MQKFNIVLCSLIIGLSSCSTNNKYQKIIEADITKNALGVDLKPKFDSIVFVSKYTAEDLTKYWVNRESPNGGNIDTLINHFKNIDDLKESEHYKWFKWQQNRFNELKLSDKNEIVFEVVKAFYKIQIPLLKTTSSVLNYYIIRKDKIVGMISESDMQDIVEQKNELTFAWEFMQYKFLKPVLP